MKSWISAGIILLAFTLSAQDCSQYYFLQQNQTIEMSMYDKKGGLTGVQTMRISDVQSAGGETRSKIQSRMVDEKGKEMGQAEGAVSCKDGIMYIDMRMNMPQEQMEAYKDMETKFNTSYLEYPSRLKTGDKLADAAFDMDVYNNGTLFSNVHLEQKNRTVTAQENVSSAAGTWNCFRIEYDSQFKATTFGIGIPMTMQIKEWFAPGFGVVKTETYRNGKLMGSTLITGLKR